MFVADDRVARATAVAVARIGTALDTVQRCARISVVAATATARDVGELAEPCDARVGRATIAVVTRDRVAGAAAVTVAGIGTALDAVQRCARISVVAATATARDVGELAEPSDACVSGAAVSVVTDDRVTAAGAIGAGVRATFDAAG